ncbi:unnamed protein product, partial [Ectocarpus fasciculatus]
GSSRASSRFAFVNAVMAHARDGGDPLDIEEACGSDASGGGGGGFAQEGYAGTPQSTVTPGSRREEGCPDWSPCDGMSSGGSASGGRLTASEQGAEPLYSQALLQAHPGSPPASPRARAEGTAGQERSAPPVQQRGKENVAPGSGAMRGGAAGGPSSEKRQRVETTTVLAASEATAVAAAAEGRGGSYSGSGGKQSNGSNNACGTHKGAIPESSSSASALRSVSRPVVQNARHAAAAVAGRCVSTANSSTKQASSSGVEMPGNKGGGGQAAAGGAVDGNG